MKKPLESGQLEQGHLKKGRYIMASLRNIVREYRDEIADGICWIAVWKEGRSWNIECFWQELRNVYLMG